MLNTIREYIERNQLLLETDKVLVGFSGGADSVALLSILVRLGYSCVALHCNFHLRGEESLRDEHFAENFANQLNVPFHKIDFDTETFAETNHLSIEMAARQLRYDWFEEMRVKLKAQAVAIAHHRDDSIETLMLNLVRGSGIRGLVGIRPRNNYIVRPLLCISRKDILEWLKKNNYSYVTDSTNLSDEFKRNFIRLRVLPLLEEMNPSVRDSLMRTTEHLAAAEKVYLSVIEKARQELWKENKIQISKLLAYPSPETILYELLHPYGFNRQVCSDIFHSLHGNSGKIFYAETYRIIKDREYLIMSGNIQLVDESFVFPVKAGEWKEPFPFTFDVLPNDESFKIEVSSQIAYFDMDKLENTLTLRKWKQGDWFIPFGMKGRKKISDYFSDKKYTLQQKEDAWLLCNGDSIIWLVNERSDNRFRVQPSTKRILVVKKIV